jgi:hypothetical protein
MKTTVILLLPMLTVLAFSPRCCAEGGGATSSDPLEPFLLSYIQGRLEQAQLDHERLTKREEAGVATLSQILGAEDEIDRWQLHLRLLTEGRLIAEHPVLTELRREFHVPELDVAVNQSTRDAAARMAGEYLQKKLARAERILGSAKTLVEMERATEGDVLAARNAVDAIKLLLEAERHNLGDAME